MINMACPTSLYVYTNIWIARLSQELAYNWIAWLAAQSIQQELNPMFWSQKYKNNQPTTAELVVKLYGTDTHSEMDKEQSKYII